MSGPTKRIVRNIPEVESTCNFYFLAIWGPFFVYFSLLFLSFLALEGDICVFGGQWYDRKYGADYYTCNDIPTWTSAPIALYLPFAAIVTKSVLQWRFEQYGH